MSFIPLIATLVTVFLGSALSGFEEGLLFGLIVALVSSQLVLRKKFNHLQQQIDRLREMLAGVSLRASDTMIASEPDGALTVAADASPNAVAEVEPAPLENPTEDDSQPNVEPPAAASSIPPAAVSPDPEPVPRAKNPADHIEDLIRRAGNIVIGHRKMTHSGQNY